MVGGLKATILTDWVHTFILLIIIIIFALTTYASHDVLGSPSAVYDLLVQAASRHPVDGNKDGSYLTMQSREGAIFFVINIVGEFGGAWSRHSLRRFEANEAQVTSALSFSITATTTRPLPPLQSTPFPVTLSAVFAGSPFPG